MTAQEVNRLTNGKASELLDLVREARRTVACDVRTAHDRAATQEQRHKATDESLRAFEAVVAAIYSLTSEGAS